MRSKLAELAALTFELNVSIQPAHIAVGDNIMTDQLSRVAMEDQYKLNPLVIQTIEQMFGPIATQANK